MEGEWIDRGALWKEKARALQLRIRDRFRVAVDRRSRWPGLPEEAESYYSATLQRWILAVQRLLGDTSQPSSPSASSRFYRKRVGKDVDASDNSIIVHMLQALAVPVIGSACHIFMHGFNHIQIYGVEKLHKALLERQEGKPLLTVSNHVASVDDPLIIASLLPPSIMLNSHKVRWTLCATDRCFSNPMFSTFFRCVKVLPISRGDGLYQEGMDMALSKLNNGGWVHIFPEGSRSRDGGRTMGSSKRGVGRLVMDADNVPIVVPFVHTGMQEIMPIGSHFPKIGKRVTVLVGDPIHFEDLLLTSNDAQYVSRGTLYDAVSSRIGHRLRELKVQAENLALKQSLEVQNYQVNNTERAKEILQHTDWEAFGMGSFGLLEESSPSVGSIIAAEPLPLLDHSQKPKTARKSAKVNFSYDGSIVSRIRGYMDPNELMGFAARGLFMSRTLKESRINIQDVGPLNAWKQFFQANIFQQWNGM